jgi:hypothetical protein
VSVTLCWQTLNIVPFHLLAAMQGAAIERFAQMTDWSYYEAARRFQRVLQASGIDAALKAQGAKVRPDLLMEGWAVERVWSWPSLMLGCATVLVGPYLAQPGKAQAAVAKGFLFRCQCPRLHPKARDHRSSALFVHLLPVQDGDTVVIGDLEFDYSSDASEAGMYDRWYRERRAAGIVGKGHARWPHVTG